MPQISPPADDKTPSIIKRNIDFGISNEASPCWHDDKISTALFDAFSLFLPEGERFFIRSVHAYLNQITDPRLREDIKAFSSQEAYHTREHEVYNSALQAEGLPVQEIYQRVGNLLDTIKGNLERLSVTVGLEHLTACLGYVTLEHPELLSRSKKCYRDLWTWHAIEEIEHKAVAFEVFQLASAKLPKWQAYFLRCGALVMATKYIVRLQFGFMIQIMQLRGRPDNWKTRFAIAKAMLAKPGHYRLVFWHYLKFFRPNFFPSPGPEMLLARPWQDYFNQCANGERSSHV